MPIQKNKKLKNAIEPKGILVLQKGYTSVELQHLASDMQSIYCISFGDDESLKFKSGKFQEIRWTDDGETYLIFSYQNGRYFDHRVDMFVDDGKLYKEKIELHHSNTQKIQKYTKSKIFDLQEA